MRQSGMGMRLHWMEWSGNEAEWYGIEAALHGVVWE